VSHLVLYGSRASALTSGHTWAALRELILANWPVAARSIAAVATRGSDPGDVDAFTDLLIMAAAPETTVALQDAAIRDELTDLLSKVAVPTLVLHRRDDKLVSANEAVQLAARIPGARLELVDGSAHIHTAGDAAALAVRICAFTSGGHRSPSAQLSSREAEVLALAAEGRSNAEIGDHLSISVRTVERHLLNAYTKLGVRGRTQAISWWLRHEPGHRTA
jgi:DNA-binding CsgD family transcriptional regulator